MRKRLQKKKRLGLYQEVCFTVSLTAEPEGEHDWDHFFADLRAMLESRGLRSRGGDGPATLVVEAGRRGDGAEQQRRAVVDWLNERSEIASVKAGELIQKPETRRSGVHDAPDKSQRSQVR